MVGRGIFFNFDLLGGKSGLFGNPMPQALIPENKSPINYFTISKVILWFSAMEDVWMHYLLVEAKTQSLSTS